MNQLACRIDWKAGDCARELSRRQRGRQQQRTQPGQATGPVSPLLALCSQLLCELRLPFPAGSTLTLPVRLAGAAPPVLRLRRNV